MSEENNNPKGEAERIPQSPGLEGSGQVEIETGGVFNQDYLEESGAFIDNPMLALLKPLTQYFDSIKPKVFKPPKTEHKVKIFYLPPVAPLEHIEAIATTMEAFLNDGYCCHGPTIINDYVIMDFSRRKEIEENEKI
jgi:hypothetical protein